MFKLAILDEKGNILDIYDEFSLSDIVLDMAPIENWMYRVMKSASHHAD